MNSYVIDTNIVNYNILDGELWAWQPASLMRARLELVVAYRQAGENFETTNKFYPSLCLLKLAHQWCVTQRPRLFISPTVHTEMMQAPQVSVLVIKLEYWYTSIELFQDTGVVFFLGVEELLLGFEG